MGYRGKTVERERARDLRAQGWTRDVELDIAVLERRRRARSLSGNEGARQRGPNRLQRRKQAEIEQLRLEGIERVGTPSERELLMAGLAYYSGEGAKTDGAVKFANSDPRLIVFFMRWLHHFFDIDETRLRVHLYLHEGLDLDSANAFWAGLTGIPLAQFRKPYRAVPDPSIRRFKHPMGCASVTYSCARTHRSIMGMIDALLSSTDPGDAGPPSGS